MPTPMPPSDNFTYVVATCTHCAELADHCLSACGSDPVSTQYIPFVRSFGSVSVAEAVMPAPSGVQSVIVSFAALVGVTVFLRAMYPASVGFSVL